MRGVEVPRDDRVHVQDHAHPLELRGVCGWGEGDRAVGFYRRWGTDVEVAEGGRVDVECRALRGDDEEDEVQDAGAELVQMR